MLAALGANTIFALCGSVGNAAYPRATSSPHSGQVYGARFASARRTR
jgi:hypothetical protein